MRQALPEMLKVGLRQHPASSPPRSAVLGTVLGMLVAVMGLSRSRWLRWPARIYTDIFRGLPASRDDPADRRQGLAPLGLGTGGDPTRTRWGSSRCR